MTSEQNPVSRVWWPAAVLGFLLVVVTAFFMGYAHQEAEFDRLRQRFGERQVEVRWLTPECDCEVSER